jgi:hypothetical protein
MGFFGVSIGAARHHHEIMTRVLFFSFQIPQVGFTGEDSQH